MIHAVPHDNSVYFLQLGNNVVNEIAGILCSTANTQIEHFKGYFEKSAYLSQSSTDSKL